MNKRPETTIEIETKIDLESQKLRDAEAETIRLELQLSEALATGRVSGRKTDPAQIRRKLAESKQAAEDCRRSMDWLKGRLPQARIDDKLFRAAHLEEKAAEKIKAAEEIEAAVNEHLDQIEALQGVRYVAPAVGQFSGRRSKSSELRRQAFMLSEQAEGLKIDAEIAQRKLDAEQPNRFSIEEMEAQLQ